MIDSNSEKKIYIASLLSIASSGGGGGTISGSISSGQVAYGTAVDTIGGESTFTYDSANNVLSVETLLITNMAVSQTADETIAVGDVVRFVTSSDIGLTAGRVIKSNATSYDDSVSVGVSLTSGNQGDSISVAIQGQVGITFASAPASTSNGQKVYLSTTDGQATLTAPSSPNAVAVLGRLIGADGVDTKPNVLIRFEEPIAP